jgi:hypothetical protein
VHLASGAESFEAWRERDHDDLCLARCCALWYGRRAPVNGANTGAVVLTPPKGEDKIRDIDQAEAGGPWLGY